MKKRSKKFKIAIVTDWLTNMGGAERVVLELHKLFPDAPIYTSLFDEEKMPLFEDADIRTSFIQKLPYAKKKHQLFPVLRWWYFSRLDLSEYDLVISASGAEAKGVMGSRGKMSSKRSGKGPFHINYCHSPTHYYWVRPDEYIKNPGFNKYLDSVMRLGLKFFLKRARAWDYLAAQQPDIMIANSTITKERIKKYYDREVESIIFPPVDLSRFKHSGSEPPRSGFVISGRQVHYKRIDLAVIACTRLGLPLKVIGFGGPEHEKLRAAAGPSVKFLTNVGDEELVTHLRSSEAFIFPGVEDFGIVAAEAMAAGTPVIAYHDGGALDQVIEGRTGMFFGRQNVRSLSRVLKQFDASKFSSSAITAHAQKFSVPRFRKEIKEILKEILNNN